MASELDEATLLSAILSGGVIGGTVAIADRSLERARYAIPVGMLAGIFLDYHLKKRQNKENIELAKGYFERLADFTSKANPMGPTQPDYNTDPYWSSLAQSLASLATIGLASGGMKAFLGYFTTAAIPPRLFIPQPPSTASTASTATSGDISVAHELPPLDVGGNPISAVINPTTIQLMAAFSGARAPVRHAGTQLAASVVSTAVIQSGLVDKLIDAVTSDAIRTVVTEALREFTDALVNGLDVVEQNTMLTNERLLLVQDPTGTKSFAVLQNGGGQTEEVPALRLPLEQWEHAQTDLANRLNITPSVNPPGYSTPVRSITGDIDLLGTPTVPEAADIMTDEQMLNQIVDETVANVVSTAVSGAMIEHGDDVIHTSDLAETHMEDEVASIYNSVIRSVISDTYYEAIHDKPTSSDSGEHSSWEANTALNKAYLELQSQISD